MNTQTTDTTQEFVFYAEGVGRDVVAVSVSEREAHRLAWSQLTDEEQDNCRGLDLVGVRCADGRGLCSTCYYDDGGSCTNGNPGGCNMGELWSGRV